MAPEPTPPAPPSYPCPYCNNTRCEPAHEEYARRRKAAGLGSFESDELFETLNFLFAPPKTFRRYPFLGPIIGWLSGFSTFMLLASGLDAPPLLAGVLGMSLLIGINLLFMRRDRRVVEQAQALDEAWRAKAHCPDCGVVFYPRIGPVSEREREQMKVTALEILYEMHRGVDPARSDMRDEFRL